MEHSLKKVGKELFRIYMLSNIPFTIISTFILGYYILRLVGLFRDRKVLDQSWEVIKAYKIKILIHKFIIAILLIEFSSNIFGGLSGLVYGFVPIYGQKPVPFTNSCHINIQIDFLMQKFPKGWFAYFPGLLNTSIILTLQPTVSLLLNVLRRAYLDRPYRTIIKRWMCIILLRGCILILLFCFYQTIYIGIITLPIFYIIDFTVYNVNSRHFYFLLKGRMEFARVHSSQVEYKSELMVFQQYKLTSVYTTLTFFTLTMLYTIFGIEFTIHGSIRTSCFMNTITLGYFPKIFYDSAALDILNIIIFHLFLIVLSLDYLYQFLISFAYILVCIAIVIKFFRQIRMYKQINKSIQSQLTEYHNDLPQYQTNESPSVA